MQVLKMMSPEAYQAEGSPINFSMSDLNFLKEAIKKSNRNRSRICSHSDNSEELHEMFVIYGRETYVRPNRHFGKDESVFILEGACDVYFFDLNGYITDIIELSSLDPQLAYFCRIPKEIFHTVVIKSDKVILFEATSGPFDPNDTYYSDWSPEEDNNKAIEKFNLELERSKTKFKFKTYNPDKYQKINDQVFASKTNISSFLSKDHLFLNDQMNTHSLDRVRICSHTSPNEHLHEMLMMFSNTTFIRPSMHTDKEESLFILEGTGRYVFFDELGAVTKCVELSPPSGLGKCYCRIPKNTFHMLIVDSDKMLVKETTNGPFDKNNTIFPTWAPDEATCDGAADYLRSVESGIMKIQ